MDASTIDATSTQARSPGVHVGLRGDHVDAEQNGRHLRDDARQALGLQRRRRPGVRFHKSPYIDKLRMSYGPAWPNLKQAVKGMKEIIELARAGRLPPPDEPPPTA